MSENITIPTQQPVVQTPQRRGLPVWAWILIVLGVLIFIGLIIFLIVRLSRGSSPTVTVQPLNTVTIPNTTGVPTTYVTTSS